MKAATSVRRQARIAGAFYLATTILGLFAEFSRDSLVAHNDPPRTAHNILAAETLYRSSAAADLAASGCYLVVTLLLYHLLVPVNRRLSLLAAVFSVVGIAIGSVALLLQTGALFLLGSESYLHAFSDAQVQVLSYVSFRMHAQAYDIALFFFGVYCILLGYLIIRSTFLPRAVGVLMILAGIVYIVTTFADIVAPQIGRQIPDAISYLTLLGEGSLTIWLLVFGVDAAKWEQRAAAEAAG